MYLIVDYQNGSLPAHMRSVFNSRKGKHYYRNTASPVKKQDTPV